MTTPSSPDASYKDPQTWLTHALNALTAWSNMLSATRHPTDEQKKAATAGDQALLDLLEGLIAAGGVQSQWTDAERQQVGQVFFTHMSHGKTSYSLQSAFQRLDELSPIKPRPGIRSRLTLALIDAGCFPSLPRRGQEVPPKAPHPSWSTWVQEYLHTPDVLERLLDTPNAYERFSPNFYAPGTGTSLPTGWSSNPMSMSGDATGWAWIVRNTPAACVEMWLTAGADPSAVDKVGRPVLAYANNPANAQVLMRAGVDPLNPARPRDERLLNLRAVWEGWSTCMHWFLGDPEKHAPTKPLLDYVKNKTALWPQEDVQAGLAEVLFAMHVRQNTRGMFNTEPLATLLADLTGLTTSWSSTIVQDDHPLPFDVAFGVRSLSGASHTAQDVRSMEWETPSHHMLPNGMPSGALHALLKAKSGSLWSIPALKAYKENPSDLFRSAQFVVSSTTTIVQDDSDLRLPSMMKALLSDDLSCLSGVAEAQSQLVSAYLDFVHSTRMVKRYDKLCSAHVPVWAFVEPVADWLQRNPLHPTDASSAARALWGCQILASTSKPGDPAPAPIAQDAARNAIVQAITPGHNLDDLITACGAPWKSAMLRDPNLSALIAARSSHAQITQALPIKSRKVRPSRM